MAKAPKKIAKSTPSGIPTSIPTNDKNPVLEAASKVLNIVEHYEKQPIIFRIGVFSPGRQYVIHIKVGHMEYDVFHDIQRNSLDPQDDIELDRRASGHFHRWKTLTPNIFRDITKADYGFKVNLAMRKVETVLPTWQYNLEDTPEFESDLWTQLQTIKDPGKTQEESAKELSLVPSGLGAVAASVTQSQSTTPSDPTPETNCWLAMELVATAAKTKNKAECLTILSNLGRTDARDVMKWVIRKKP